MPDHPAHQDLRPAAPGFSWADSAIIAVSYVAVLLPGAVTLAYRDGRRSRALFGTGVALLIFAGLNIGVQETAQAQALTAAQWTILLALLIAMLLVYAAHVVLVLRWARGGRSRHPART